MKILFLEFCLSSQFPKPCGPEGSVSEPLGRYQTASLALPSCLPPSARLLGLRMLSWAFLPQRMLMWCLHWRAWRDCTCSPALREGRNTFPTFFHEKKKKSNDFIHFFFFFGCICCLTRASLGAQSVKTLPAVWETQVRSLRQEDPLEEDMAAHASILAW